MTAVASKPAIPKLKRPAAPQLQTSLNGAKPFQASLSPSSAPKRLPSQKNPVANSAATNGAVNGAARPNRQRKDTQRPGEQYGRLQRLQTRGSAMDGGGGLKSASKKFPEPYVASEAHMLKKFKGKPPSLIVHLFPTYFRFDQQDGSFSYHSEMRLFIEHLQKKTIPHDMLEEFRQGGVQFYDGWLIVRVVDHKSVAAAAASSSDSASDRQTAYSVHNHNPYITPSPYVPYPAADQAKPPTRLSPSKQKQDGGERNSSQPTGESSSTVNGDNPEGSSRPKKPQPRIFHVALRPTILSKHMDLVIDSMTPDPRALTRRQSQYAGARPSSSANLGAPTTPLSTVPPTPTHEKGPPLKRLKMKIDPDKLQEYESRIINATAPPVYLEPVENAEEAAVVQRMLKDPGHDEPPPSPKGRKRTVAELAADDAFAKDQERFMLIMDERFPSGAAGATAASVDGQVAVSSFNPTFERYTALENIKQQVHDRKQRELEMKMQADAARRAEQAHAEEQRKRAQEQIVMQQQELMRRRAAQQAQQQAISQVNGVPPNMRHQIQASQAQGSSPVVRTSTPHMNLSPVVGQMKPGHGIPMAATPSNQGGAGSPPRPGSALQHGHPGAPMARGPSNQGPSRHGTPQVPHSTPGMPSATPVLRHGTPAQPMSQASPHAGMIANASQMGQPMVAPGQMPNGMPHNAAQAHARQQFLLQQQAISRQQMTNQGPMTPEQLANLQAQAQQHARMASMQQHPQLLLQSHPASQPNPSAMTQASYNVQLREVMKHQMAQVNQPAMQQGSPPQTHPTPQQHAMQIQQVSQPNQHQPLQGGLPQQMPNGMPGQPPQVRPSPQQQQQQLFFSLSNRYFQTYIQQTVARLGGDARQLTDQHKTHAKQQAQMQARKDIQEMMRRQAQQQAHQMAGGGPAMGMVPVQQGQQMGQQQMNQAMMAHIQNQNQAAMLQYQQQMQ